MIWAWHTSPSSSASLVSHAERGVPCIEANKKIVKCEHVSPCFTICQKKKNTQKNQELLAILATFRTTFRIKNQPIIQKKHQFLSISSGKSMAGCQISHPRTSGPKGWAAGRPGDLKSLIYPWKMVMIDVPELKLPKRNKKIGTSNCNTNGLIVLLIVIERNW